MVYPRVKQHESIQCHNLCLATTLESDWQLPLVGVNERIEELFTVEKNLVFYMGLNSKETGF